MPSFDVVSEVNLDEMRHATENSTRELSTRFDFRGVEASFEWKSPTVTVKTQSEYQVNQMVDILRGQLVKRKIDPQAMEISKPELSGKTCLKKVTIKEGIEKDVAKKLVKLIKDKKMKVQVAIQGEELRVTGKKRDDLQAVMQVIREADLGQPFQFKNFKD
ncbi:YajQ family cyclic di-GMP-binding protein [Paraferrimonas sp. SM1919]|uniref:YajQ family cyclic di-GMP-binding protein n=1 Tax=Paraferrimonas sp. SM1919 TaxID=2662263 RepID=UPI0013CF9682|nr:YajQ family cyclic di-GMP-binding protein [Paraferrimonas sp. SM1919]